jgi:acyl-CoA thioesterase FadM
VLTFHREIVLGDLSNVERLGATSLEDLPHSQRHVRYDHVVGLFWEAWMAFLLSFGEELLPKTVAVVHAETDYTGQVEPGPVTIDVAVSRIGRSSFALSFDLQQDGTSRATSVHVFVHQDWAALKAQELNETQRALLTGHLVSPVAVS